MSCPGLDPMAGVKRKGRRLPQSLMGALAVRAMAEAGPWEGGAVRPRPERERHGTDIGLSLLRRPHAPVPPTGNPNHQASTSKAGGRITCALGPPSEEEETGSGWKRRGMICTE